MATGPGFRSVVAPRVVEQGTTGGFGGEFSDPFGAATDAAVKLYVADNFNNRIQVFGEAVDPPSTGNGDSQTGTQVVYDPYMGCPRLLRALKKAKTKRAKKKIRRQLRKLECL